MRRSAEPPLRRGSIVAHLDGCPAGAYVSAVRDGSRKNDTSSERGTDTGIFSVLAWAVVILLVIYPLSIGPMAKLIPNPPPPLRATYAPIGFLVDHFKPVRSFYDWYAKVWGVRL